MKKFLSILLILTLVVSVTACGKKEEEKKDGLDDIQIGVQDTTTPEPTKAETKTDDVSGNKSDDVTTTPAEQDNGEEDVPGDISVGDPEVTPIVRPSSYVRADDEDIYEQVLGEFTALSEKAKAADSVEKRFIYFAQAEAYLLDSAVMIPTTTKGGAYTLSRQAYRTVPYVQWGNDEDRLKGIVLSDEFITKEERADLVDMWKKAVAGEAAYDPAGYLTSKGHTLKKDYAVTFSTAPVTIDWLNTSYQADTVVTVNCVDGLVEYNNLGQMVPALAENWSVSDDGLTYTFNIRKGVYWYTAEGQPYAEVTAKDFEAGFRHMLDAQQGLEWLIDGVIVGGTNYYANGGSWDEVGYKATDDYTLTITLEQPISYFLTMLTYSCFLPMCDSFYKSRGGVYGVAEYAEASLDTQKYTFGKADDVASQVYCGPFLIQKLQKDSEILLVRNTNYYKNDEVMLDTIKFVFDDGSNPDALYNDACNGIYGFITLTQATGLLDKAKADGNFDKYSYVSDTDSTSYFGGLNVNRGTFALESGACASTKTEDQKIDTQLALLNKNFRKAVQHAFDKGTQNATDRGEDLKYTNLRNMYTHPQFVQLENAAADDEGHTFPAGTFYGDIVQYYLDKLGCKVNVQDGIDGWYQPDAAKEYLAKAKEELGDAVSYPIQIDVVYLSTSERNTAQAAAYKKVVEDCLGSANVQVNLIEATTTEDFYASGYRAPNGEAGNYDMFYGSGWGPDYGDPSTYLDTFLGEGAGYMSKVIGLF